MYNNFSLFAMSFVYGSLIAEKEFYLILDEIGLLILTVHFILSSKGFEVPLLMFEVLYLTCNDHFL